MPVKSLENAKRILLATALTGLCWALPGCQSITPASTFAEIRFINAAADAPGLDIYENNTAIIYSVGFAQVSSYVPISPGSYRIAAKTGNVTLVTTTASISTGHQYTVLIADDTLAGFQETVITDQSQSAPGGQIAIRVINEATQSGPYDVYMVPSGTMLINVRPILTNVAFSNISGYINIPTGSYSMEIVPAGTVLTGTTVATNIGSDAVVAYTGGSAHTFLILDQQIITNPGAQVITTDDYESPSSVPQ